MIGEQVMRDGTPKLANPPLYVIAFSMSGARHECLLEEQILPPEWFAGEMHVRIEAPSGEAADFDLLDANPSEGYDTCLSILGADRGWAPTIRERGPLLRLPELDIDLLGDSGVEIAGGAILRVEPRPDGSKANPRSDRFRGAGTIVVRNGSGSSIEAVNSGLFFLQEVPSSAATRDYAPWCLLDTGLPGAFWGFSEHQNANASFLTAVRLLSVLFDQDGSGKTSDPAWLAAAAHAVLAHRRLLPEYGERILESLGSGKMAEPEATLLSVLVGMARLSTGHGDEDVVRANLKEAISLLSSNRPMFGETVRRLDAIFNVLAELVVRDAGGVEVQKQLADIRNWLSHAYPGGQAAAYRIQENGREARRPAAATSPKKKV